MIEANQIQALLKSSVVTEAIEVIAEAQPIAKLDLGTATIYVLKGANGQNTLMVQEAGGAGLNMPVAALSKLM